MTKDRKPPWASPGYRPDIDGLRAVSILSVVYFHAYPHELTAGFIGVDIFFVISGFLIGGLISSEIAAGTFTFASFYARRVRRIFPALVLVMAFVYAVGWKVMFPEEFRQLGRHIAAASVFVSNFVLLEEVGYFDMEAHTKPLLHLWSLAIEEQFYLLWPLFAWVLRGRRALFISLTVAAALVSFALNVTSAEVSTTAFYSPQTRFWELAIGVLVAHLPREAMTRWVAARWLREAAVVAGLARHRLCGLLIDARASFPGWWVLLPVLGAATVIAVGPHSFASRYVLGSRPMVFVGKISYPLYLWHWPLFAFTWLAYGTQPPSEVALPLIAASFVLAWLTYQFVEKPVRFGVWGLRPVPTLAILALLLGATGLLTMQRDGFAGRAVAAANRSLAYELRVPTDSRTSDGSCAKKYGIETGDSFVCFVNAAAPRMLIVGDSVSMAFNSAIHAGMVKEDAALIGAHSFNWRLPACALSGDFQAWLKGPELCKAVIRGALAILAREPSIEALVLPTFAGNPFFGNPQAITALQDAVFALGKKVVYVTSVPQYSRSPGGCKTRKLDFLGIDLTRAPDIESCGDPRPALEAALKNQRTLFEAMAAGKPNAAVFDSMGPLCDATYCRQGDAQGLLFWSWAHVNERGSLRILNDFLPWLHKTVLRGG